MEDPGEAPTADALGPFSERPELGGRSVNASGINNGLLRCPRCASRLLSLCGALRERDAPFWVPSRAIEPAEAGEEETYEWNETRHTHWWRVEDVGDVDNLGLSRVVESPMGRLKLALCIDCRYGPFGYQLEAEAQIWLCTELLHQQDASLADDQADFRLPDGIDMSQLKAMIESGSATVQYHVTIEEQRLGMVLADAADGLGVEVNCFTEFEGSAGPAERTGKIRVGDRVVRVNGESTRDEGYAAVLDRVIAAPRPITIHFERNGGSEREEPAARAQHVEWKGEPQEPEAGAGADAHAPHDGTP